MAHRPILNDKQRDTLLSLPTREHELLQYYILSHEDLSHINTKRKASNRLGFALQLCAFRYPGRLLQKKEIIPQSTVMFLAAQLGISDEELGTYGIRSETRYEHSSELQHIYGFRVFQEAEEQSFLNWLMQRAIETRNNAELAELFVQECRKRKTILPGITIIERLCAEARLAAERDVVGRIAERLDDTTKTRLNAMLTETIDGRLTVHGWLKRFEVGHNSSDVNRLLDKLEYLKELNIPESILEDVPSHRVI
jgi:TnpA family transposase